MRHRTTTNPGIDTPLPELAPGDTVVTSTRGLTSHLLDGFDRARAESGAIAWETPDIVPWDAWLERLWRERTNAGSAAVLLTPAQETVLWEQIVTDDLASGPWPDSALVRADVAAGSAADAWRLQHSWCVNPTAGYANADQYAYQRWSRRFAYRTHTTGVIDSARLAENLIDLVRADRIRLPRRLWLVGFDQLTPAAIRWLQCCGGCGVDIRFWLPAVTPRRAPVVREFIDAEEEFAYLAGWARAKIESDPRAEIGIIVPDLAAQRLRAERHLEDRFYPNRSRLPQSVTDSLYHLSLGTPLAEVPVIAAALHALRFLLDAVLPVSDHGSLLRSPFLRKAGDEAFPRAAADAWLREQCVTVVHFRRGAIRLPPTHPAAACWNAWLAMWRKQRREMLAGGQRAPSRWVGSLTRALQAVGWPGERTLNQTEHQATDAFRDLLAEVMSLDSMEPVVDGKAVYRRLCGMARARLFQPRAQSARVRVMGFLEAAGMRFTDLWISGLHDQAWPPDWRAHPLLPLSVQRRAGIPAADPHTHLLASRHLLARAIGSAGCCILSFPGTDGRHEFSPSPLIGAYSRQQPGDRDPPVPIEPVAGEDPPVIEVMADDIGLPVQGPVSGGANLLRDQAACPFRGYARFRLGATTLEEPEPGLNARVRGQLAHRLLQGIWSELGSHAGLCQADTEELESRVRHRTSLLLRRLGTDRLYPGGRPFAELETDRLTALAMQWLELERRRAPFQVVNLEQTESAAIGSIRVTLRPDRVDRLDDGSLVIIDYKTGDVSARVWSGERPDEPQLPLYALLFGDKVGAIAFACLKPGGLGFTGIADKAGIADGVARWADTSFRDHGRWADLVQAWRTVVTTLAEAVAAGDARVDPKSAPQTCRLCEIRPLCRVDSP